MSDLRLVGSLFLGWLLFHVLVSVRPFLEAMELKAGPEGVFLVGFSALVAVWLVGAWVLRRNGR